MKKLLTAVLFAAAVATPLAASAASMPKVEKSAAQPAKAKGVWIDVRSAEEFKEGHLQGALNIPHDQIVDRIKSVSPDKNATTAVPTAKNAIFRLRQKSSNT